MSPPVLFLDVDGVLNRRDTKPGDDGVRECVLRPPHSDWPARFTGVVETAKVAAVAGVVQACGAKIVVSSSWRNYFTNAADFATAVGMSPPLADAPDMFHRDWRTGFKVSSCRCHEINWWLDDNPKVKRYAILDDHTVFPPDWPGAAHEVNTDASVGITNRDLNRVAELLGRPDPSDWFSSLSAAA